MQRRLSLIGLVAVLAVSLSDCSSPPKSASDNPPTFGPLTCFETALHTTPPSGGWLPSNGGVVDWNLFSGTLGSPSPTTVALASYIAPQLGRIFERPTEADLWGTNRDCVVERTVTFTDRAGDSVGVQALQLAKPLSTDSFSLLGYGQSVSQVTLPDGTVVITAHTADDSYLGAFVASANGLVVDVIAGTAKGAGLFSGYPTTTAPPPGTGPPYPASPVDLTQARSVALDASSFLVTS